MFYTDCIIIIPIFLILIERSLMIFNKRAEENSIVGGTTAHAHNQSTYHDQIAVWKPMPIGRCVIKEIRLAKLVKPTTFFITSERFAVACVGKPGHLMLHG